MLWVCIVIFVGIQFLRPGKNSTTAPQQAAIYNRYPAAASVKAILAKACNDCHSNNTRYPWYAAVQPVGWWLDTHVKDGKGNLNFDEFLQARVSEQNNQLEEAIKEVKKGGMPLGSYTWIHTDARLTEPEKQELCNWFASIRDTIRATYPRDSLEMRNHF